MFSFKSIRQVPLSLAKVHQVTCQSLKLIDTGMTSSFSSYIWSVLQICQILQRCKNSHCIQSILEVDLKELQCEEQDQVLNGIMTRCLFCLSSEIAKKLCVYSKQTQEGLSSFILKSQRETSQAKNLVSST